MIHEDGIEVYLKPVGPDSDNVRFAEFPLDHVQINGEPDSDRNRRCVILARAEAFQVVVRIRESFKMYSANALAISTNGLPKPTTSEPSTVPIHSLPVVMREMFEVYEQHVIRSLGWERDRGNNRITKALRMKHSAEAITGEFDGLQSAKVNVHTPQDGTVLIAVQRCNAQWIDKAGASETVSNSLYGPGDPTIERKLVRKSWKGLASKNGVRYFFEFRYRSQDFISALQQPPFQQPPGLSHAADIAFLVADSEFVAKREQDRIKRQELSAKYQKQQQQITAKNHEAERPESRARTPNRTFGNAKKAPPKFCDCRNPVHKRTRQEIPSKSRSKSLKAVGLEVSSSTPRAESSDGHIADEEFEEGSDPVELAVAPTCVSCNNLKVPKSKRPAFLKKWSLGGDVLSRQAPRNQPSRPILADSSNLEDGPDDMLSQPGSAREILGQEDDGDVELPDEGALSHSEPVDASPSATAAEMLFRAAYAHNTGSAGSSTIDAGDEPDPPVRATTDERADETVQYQERSGSADLSGAKGNVPSVQKRSPEVLLHPRPSKQQRTSSDLTNQHTEDPVIVKAEQIERKESNFVPLHEEDEEDGEMQAKLEDIDRELRIERLEKQRAEIVRKQKQKQKEAAMKRANAVKVKQEIIEIEDD